MAKYTTELRHICESLAHERGVPNGAPISEIIPVAAGAIFDPFTIGTEEHTVQLSYKILRHFYTREIGFEVYGLWRHYFNTKIAEIAPYYDEMCKAYTDYLALNAYNNYDVKTTRHHGESESTSGTQNTQSNGNTKSESTTANATQSVNKFSNTPQGSLTNVMEGRYLTTANVNDDTSDSRSVDENETATHAEQTTSGTATRQRDETEQTLGRSGVAPAAVFKEVAANIQNIDALIIAELEPLFMQIW